MKQNCLQKEYVLSAYGSLLSLVAQRDMKDPEHLVDKYYQWVMQGSEKVVLKTIG